MTTSISQEKTQSTPEKATTKARVAKRRAPAAPAKAKPARKASAAKKPAPARRGSKTAKILELLKRPGGVTLKELIEATGWQAHYADVQIMPTCVGNPACGAVIAAMESA
jgi:hypothetical protein